MVVNKKSRFSAGMIHKKKRRKKTLNYEKIKPLEKPLVEMNDSERSKIKGWSSESDWTVNNRVRVNAWHYVFKVSYNTKKIQQKIDYLCSYAKWLRHYLNGIKQENGKQEKQGKINRK